MTRTLFTGAAPGFETSSARGHQLARANLLVVLALTLGCSTEATPAASSAGAGGMTPDASTAGTAGGGTAGGGSASLPCEDDDGCAADQFCGASSKTCVSDVVQVAAGLSHTCSLHRDTSVRCWGAGVAVTPNLAEVVGPTLIEGLDTPHTLAAGAGESCVVTAEELVQCWSPALTTIVKEDGAPLDAVSELAMGSTYGCALNPEGTWCWGRNQYGQLARPLDFEYSEAALLTLSLPSEHLSAGFAVVTHDGDQRVCAWGSNLAKVVMDENVITLFTEPRCDALDDVIALSVGEQHACARHSDGTFSCWGERYYGQLGIGGDLTEDIPPYGTPTAFAENIVDLVAGASHTCVLLESGLVQCFGLNSLGQVGPNPDTDLEEVRNPASVTGFSGAVVALGSGSRAQHTCAVLESGSVECWGKDAEGQLGRGNLTIEERRSSPMPAPVHF